MLRKKLRKAMEGRRGSALMMTLMFTTIFSLIIGWMLVAVNQETRQTHRSRMVINSLEGSKATLQSMASTVTQIMRSRPADQINGDLSEIDNVVKQVTPTLSPGMEWVDNGNGKRLTYIRNRKPNDFEFREITAPTEKWYGYSIAQLDYEMVSFVREETPIADQIGFQGMGVRQRATINYIPLYAFAIFYEDRLELHPGPEMDVRGRTHSNDNMYLSAVNSLQFHDRVTCARNIYRWRDTGGTTSQNGRVEFRVPNDINNPGGSWSWQNMRNPPSPHDGDQWFDHMDDSWADGALNRYKRQVMDSAHGISEIKPPLPAGAELYDLFRRAQPDTDPLDLKQTKFEYLADIIITGDPGNPLTWKAYFQDVDYEGDYSRTLDEIPSASVANFVSQGLFYEAHQLTITKTLDIDIAALNTEMASLGFNWADSNGVIYVSTTPGPDDTYALADRNKDPEWQRDPDGSYKFDLSTGKPLLVAGGNAGWSADGNGSTPDAKNYYMPAVRILNADYLPRNQDKGFAFYSDRPVYTVGDVNDQGEQATAVIAGDSITVTSVRQWLAEINYDGRHDDGKKNQSGSNMARPEFDTSLDGRFTVLGNGEGPSGAVQMAGMTVNLGDNWRDGQFDWEKDHWYSKSQRNTTTNVIFIMGNTPSEYNNPEDSDDLSHAVGSGGAHNVMRYLENWDDTHNFKGSMIVLFESPVAAVKWRCCNNKGFYTPPRRNYDWDTRLKTSTPPPGMPVLIEVDIYEMEPVSYEYAKANVP